MHGRIIPFVAGLLTFTAGIIYAAQRTAFFFGLSYSATIVVFILLFFSVVAILTSSFYVKGTSAFKHFLTYYGCYMGGLLVYLLMTTLLMELVSAFANISPLSQGLITYAITIVWYAYSVWSTWHTTTPQITIEIPTIENETRIAHLSDIHIGHFRGRKWMEGVVKRVNRQKPDFVVITGDIFESFYNLSEEVLEPLKAIEAPIFFVTGNHDSYVNIPRIKTMLQKCGVQAVDNSKTEFKGIQIIGIAYNSKPETVLNKLEIEKTKPSVMLYHFPKGVDAACRAGIDLVLAGHTHGGQFFPLTLINHFAFRFNSGLHKYADTYIYTSTGAGTTGPPLRFGTFSEIPIITLKRKKMKSKYNELLRVH